MDPVLIMFLNCSCMYVRYDVQLFMCKIHFHTIEQQSPEQNVKRLVCKDVSIDKKMYTVWLTISFTSSTLFKIPGLSSVVVGD